LEHTQIVTSSELDAFGETTISEGIIPELIWWLVNESVPDLTACRIPYGEAVNQTGYDGLVETAGGYRQFVPRDRSYWEIGTGADPQVKATKDFRKRTKYEQPATRALIGYVFVTPRSSGPRGWPEPAQSKWRQRRKNSGWRELKVLDGVQIADWLRDYPAIAKWLLKKMGQTRSSVGLETAAEHWELLTALALPPATFLTGREVARDQVLRLFNGEISQLILGIEGLLDAEDFIAALLESLPPNEQRAMASRCLFISEAETWMSMVKLRSRHVLVAHPSLDLESAGEKLHMAAIKAGHAVVIAASGRGAGGRSESVHLHSPSKSLLETTLREAGVEEGRAREWAGAGALNLAALKRYIRGVGAPPYADSSHARIYAEAGLIGRWMESNPADREAIEAILGKSFGEWMEVVRAERLRPETPLAKLGDAWKLMCRGEAWAALGPRLSEDDLQRFEAAAITVLSERNPALDLPPDQRHMAAIEGKTLRFSAAMREGLAETLALLGCRHQVLTSTRLGKAEGTAIVTVRKLLDGATWERWASLNGILPMLAEAAPKTFLDSVDAALVMPESSPFLGVFAQESNAFGGVTYISGLLWALESLAWSPEFLPRASSALGALAAIDPGGKFANRPANSLINIFLPWHPQTTASIAQRKVVLQILVREVPAVAWKLLLALLPNLHTSTMGTSKPTWRNWIPRDWKAGVTDREYWQQVEGYAELAVMMAAADLAKLSELVERLPDLPPPARTRVLQHLTSPPVVQLSDTDRYQLWEALVDLAVKHLKFRDAEWAMPDEARAEVERAAQALAPANPAIVHRRLFSEREFDLYEGGDNFEAQQERLEQRRQAAVREIFVAGSLAGLLDFAHSVDAPLRVGLAFGSIADASSDAAILPARLLEGEKVISAFINGYVFSRFRGQGWGWVDSLPLSAWSSEQSAALLVRLPFDPGAWERAERLLPDHGKLYWSQTGAGPWRVADQHLELAAKHLLQVDRPMAAIGCLYVLVHRKKDFSPALAMEALFKALKSEASKNQFDGHAVQEVIEWLQQRQDVGGTDLARIEWAYLPLLDHRFGGGRPKALEGQLANEPEFFCEGLGMVYRSDKETGPRAEVPEDKKRMAENAYRMFRQWETVPGVQADGSFDKDKLVEWLQQVKALTTESGHLRVAMAQIGQVLIHSPADPNGLWLHSAVAEILNARDAADMRSGFTSAMINSRGVYSFSSGADELKLVETYQKKADELDAQGFARIAAEVRRVADSYKREAEAAATQRPGEY